MKGRVIEREQGINVIGSQYVWSVNQWIKNILNNFHEIKNILCVGNAVKSYFIWA